VPVFYFLSFDTCLHFTRYNAHPGARLNVVCAPTFI
jgi:hypothetical protein